MDIRRHKSGGEVWAALASLVFLIIFALTAIAPAGAQERESHSREVAKSIVRQWTQKAKSDFLSVHRREDLEDLFCYLRQVGACAALKDPLFFEVSSDGFEFAESRTREHFSVHGPLVWVVAVSSPSEMAYRFSGFKDSVEELIRLAKDFQIKLDNEGLARDFLKLYLQSNPVGSQLPILNSPLELKQLAERKISEAYPNGSEAERCFVEWWRKSAPTAAILSFGITVSKTSGGFLVEFYTVSSVSKKSPEKGPGILKVSLSITQYGQVGVPQFIPVKSQ